MASPLENLTGPDKSLRKEPPDEKEFYGLKRSALARLTWLTDSANTSNSLESRFDLAYNAAHGLCLAALRRHGFRPANSYFKYCRTHSVWVQRSGECSTNVIPSAISANMKGISTSTTALSPI